MLCSYSTNISKHKTLYSDNNNDNNNNRANYTNDSCIVIAQIYK